MRVSERSLSTAHVVSLHAVNRTPLVALVRPPNAGKTTLFNQLTGLRQKVANYAGVTVEKHQSHLTLDGHGLDLLDLPGVTSLTGRTLDQRVTLEVLQGRMEGVSAPDAVVLVVDVTRLETHLMLFEPVVELGYPTLLVLNMCDELAARGGEVHDEVLASELGVEVVRTNARTGEGLDQVRAFLARAAAAGPRTPAPLLARSKPSGVPLPMVEDLVSRRQRVRDLGRRAGFIAPTPSSVTERLDNVLLHRVWGPLAFVAILVLVFQSIFTWAVPLMDGVEAFIGWSGGALAALLPESWLRSLLIDGVWAGVGSVVVFLPQILILFAFLGLLEDSGYMARAAVIADRSMQRVGLQGRAFLPLLSAYACAVPAILAARTVSDERDRLATIFVAPFMTCSARLPVYALLIAAFIPDEPLFGPFLGLRAATLLGLYALGLLAAIVTAWALRRTLLKGPRADFMMELPPYRLPSLRSVALRLWDRTQVFLKRAGTIILTVTVVLWGMTQFPLVDGATPELEDSVLGRSGQLIEPLIEPLELDWRIGVGIVSSLAAREVIVGTLGTIYGVEEADETSFELRDALRRDLTIGSAVGLLIFYVFALQCMSTVAVMKRETGGWKWPILQFSYMLALAWIGAFAAVRLI